MLKSRSKKNDTNICAYIIIVFFKDERIGKESTVSKKCGDRVKKVYISMNRFLKIKQERRGRRYSAEELRAVVKIGSEK